MEKIIWKTQGENFNCEIYVRIRDDFKKGSGPDYFPKPYLEYVLGIRQTKPAWIPQMVTYVAEDGFAMIGDELLTVLEKQIKNYKEMEFTLYDHAQDTDAEIIFDCKKEKVVLKGTFGDTTSAGFCNFIKTNFEIEVDKEILENLYTVLKDYSRNKE